MHAIDRASSDVIVHLTTSNLCDNPPCSRMKRSRSTPMSGRSLWSRDQRCWRGWNYQAGPRQWRYCTYVSVHLHVLYVFMCVYFTAYTCRFFFVCVCMHMCVLVCVCVCSPVCYADFIFWTWVQYFTFSIRPYNMCYNIMCKIFYVQYVCRQIHTGHTLCVHSVSSVCPPVCVHKVWVVYHKVHTCISLLCIQ